MQENLFFFEVIKPFFDIFIDVELFLGNVHEKDENKLSNEAEYGKKNR